MFDLRSHLLHVASALPHGNETRRKLLSAISDAAKATEEEVATAEGLLGKMAADFAKMVGGRVVGSASLQEQSNGFFTGEIEVTLPLFPSVSSKPPQMGFQATVGQGWLMVHTILYGAGKGAVGLLPANTSLTQPLDKIPAMMKPWLSGLLDSLTPGIKLEEARRSAEPAYKAAFPMLEQAIKGALTPLGATDFIIYKPRPSIQQVQRNMVLTQPIPFGDVNVIVDGLIKDFEADPKGRTAYAAARKALARALNRFRVGEVRAKLSSKPGMWSAGRLDLHVFMYLESMEPKKLATDKTAIGSVASTILDQMGGWRRLKMMIGVQQVIDLRNGVGFKWPNKQRSKGNYVEIILTPLDLYNMTFYNVSTRGKKKVKEFRDIYNDQLVDLFERQTGWYLRMGSVTRVARRHIAQGSMRVAGSKTATLGTKVNLQGVIDAYKNGAMHVFGPLVSVKDWAGAMTAGDAEDYNAFNVKRVARYLTGQGIQRVHPAREYSVAIYFPVPQGVDPLKILKGGRSHKADEVSIHADKPDGKTLATSWGSKPPYFQVDEAVKNGKPLWIRMWWD